MIVVADETGGNRSRSIRTSDSLDLLNEVFNLGIIKCTHLTYNPVQR
jgi:hypothetical protein